MPPISVVSVHNTPILNHLTVVGTYIRMEVMMDIADYIVNNGAGGFEEAKISGQFSRCRVVHRLLITVCGLQLSLNTMD